MKNKEFLRQFGLEHGYLFCQICDRSDIKLPQCCHIYRKSEHGKHPEINNSKNMFVGCQDCHRKFDSRQMPEVYERFEKERGLKELFS